MTFNQRKTRIIALEFAKFYELDAPLTKEAVKHGVEMMKEVSRFMGWGEGPWTDSRLDELGLMAVEAFKRWTQHHKPKKRRSQK